MSELFARAEAALLCCDCDSKVDQVQRLFADWQAAVLATDAASSPPRPLQQPGRPEQPPLIEPTLLKRRKLSTPEGRATLLHALAHIEFNAVNLALDAVWHFRGMPADYYGDWLQVAAEEALHFRLLRERLRTLGHDYGAFPAHNGLWQLACRTDHDVLVRMALVPRLLEARGLDVTPGLREKLRQQGDHESCAILDIILRDEIGHVRIGNHWYRWCCEQRGLEPVATFRHLLQQYDAPALRGPFHWEARHEAGFTELERQLIEELAGLD